MKIVSWDGRPAASAASTAHASCWSESGGRPSASPTNPKRSSRLPRVAAGGKVGGGGATHDEALVAERGSGHGRGGDRPGQDRTGEDSTHRDLLLLPCWWLQRQVNRPGVRETLRTIRPD